MSVRKDEPLSPSKPNTDVRSIPSFPLMLPQRRYSYPSTAMSLIMTQRVMHSSNTFRSKPPVGEAKITMVAPKFEPKVTRLSTTVAAQRTFYSTSSKEPIGITPVRICQPSTPRQKKPQLCRSDVDISNKNSLLLTSSTTECAECGVSKETTDELKAHVTVAHCGWVPYQCKHCRYVRVATEAKLRLHYRQTHPGFKMAIVQNFDEEKQRRFDEIMQRSETTLRQKRNLENSEDEGSSQSSQRLDRESNKRCRADETLTYGGSKTFEHSTTSDHTAKSQTVDRSLTAETNVPQMAEEPKPARSTSISECRMCAAVNRTTSQTTRKSRHVWTNHINTPVYRCRHCPYGVKTPDKTAIKRHYKVRHPQMEEADFIDHRPELEEVYKKLQQDCFGDADAAVKVTAPVAGDDERSENEESDVYCSDSFISERAKLEVQETNTSPSSVEVVYANNECRLCGAKPSTEQRMVHVMLRHMEQNMRACAMCDYTAKEAALVRKHLQRIHKVAELNENVVSLQSLYQTEIEDMVKLCFHNDRNERICL